MDEYIAEPLLPKPSPTKRTGVWRRTLLSLLVFVGAAYLVFPQNLSFLLLFTGVLIIHELGHYLAMRYFGYQDLALFFVPLLGAYVSGSKSRISQRQQVIVILAGPVPGILFGLGLTYYGTYLAPPHLAYGSSTSLPLLAGYLFLALNAFNLLPAIPLDGGRVLQWMFFHRFRTLNFIFGVISALLLLGIGVQLDSWLLILFGCWVGFQTFRPNGREKFREHAHEAGLEVNQPFEELSDADYWQLRDFLGTHWAPAQKLITPGERTYSDHEGRIVAQLRSLLQPEPIEDLQSWEKLLFSLLWFSALLGPVLWLGQQQGWWGL